MAKRDSSGKNKSEIWKYFTLTGDAKKTICTLCQMNLAYSSGTSSMLKHMKYVHKSININSDATSQEGIKRQRSMMDYHRSKLVLTDQKYQALNKDLALMCATDLRPLSIVAGKGFKQFVFNLNPDYKVPSAPTIGKYVDKLYTELKQSIILELQGLQVVITTDMWTRVAQQGYLTLTHVTS